MARRSAVYSDLSPTFELDERGEIKFAYDMRSIEASFGSIMGTSKGERVFKRDFGSDLEEQLFEPIDSITKSFIESEILLSIGEWDDRIIIKDTGVTLVPDQELIVINARLNAVDLDDKQEGEFTKLLLGD